MSDPAGLVCERRGAVLVARINRPAARNALDPGVVAGIGAAVVEAERDPAVRAMVLTGTGEVAFCAGMDLRAFAAGEAFDGGDPAATAAFYRFLDGEAEVPVVGAANGLAYAGGFELLLGCDIVVASTAATFALPEVKRGLFPAGGALFLGTRIALGVALELALTGEPIDAARAFALGLVNAVVPPADVLDTALAYAERIAANGPLGVAAIRELLRLGVSDRQRARARRDELRQLVFASEDAKEGARAFLERREPVWKGR